MGKVPSLIFTWIIVKMKLDMPIIIWSVVSSFHLKLTWSEVLSQLLVPCLVAFEIIWTDFFWLLKFSISLLIALLPSHLRALVNYYVVRWGNIFPWIPFSLTVTVCITVWLFFIRLVGQNEIHGTLQKYLPQFAWPLNPKFHY